ncbi:MAG: PA2169 family four-helix-bundle protein [Cyclobacteriaceae bacterium]|nr:PA2169 family four-helix-bundle protein [Cyclobacteriaceae bacterium]
MSTEQKEHASEILNDLLKINNDRIEGYRKANKETEDEDLKNLFEEMEDESESIVNSLIKEIASLGGTPEAGSTTNPGKIYRVWMDVKATFNGKDRKGILNACEFGEDAAQSAYRTALKDEELPLGIRALIKSQQVELKLSHDSIKALRDSTN